MHIIEILSCYTCNQHYWSVLYKQSCFIIAALKFYKLVFAMFKLLFSVLTARALDLGRFIGKDVRMFFSAANHVFLGLDTVASSLTARSKYYDLANFYTVARLVPDGPHYRLRYKDSYVRNP